MTTIKTRAALESSLDALGRIDPAMKKLWRKTGTPNLRRRKPGFETLMRVIVGQQISVKAAASIWLRLTETCQPFNEATVLAAGDEKLRAAGLSRAKTAYAQSLAEALTERRVVLRRVHRMPDDEAIDTLVDLKGIGRWSAECYLLFALGRTDLFPAADLALANAYQLWQGHDARLKEPALRTIAETWQPQRSAAARLLWHAYGLDVF